MAIIYYLGPFVWAIIPGQITYMRETKAVNKQLAAIKAKGEPACAMDLYGTPIPNDKNAAVVYEEVFKAISPDSIKAEINKIRDYVSCIEDRKKTFSTKDWTDFQNLTHKHSHLMPVIKKAASMPLCKYHIEWEKDATSKLLHLPKLRQINGLLLANAILEAKNGNIRTATSYINLSIALSNSLRNETHMISQLVRYGLLHTTAKCVVAIVRENKIDYSTASSLIHILDTAEVSGSYKTAMLGERALRSTLMDDILYRRVALDEEDAKSSGAISRLIPKFKAYIRTNEKLMISYFTQQIESADRPYREFTAADYPSPFSNPSADMFTKVCSIYPRMAGLRDRTTSLLDGSIIAIKLNCYKGKYGKYPDNLQILQIKTRHNIPNDPFSGKSFIYKPIGNGYLLYSISTDLIDNGGKELPSGAKADKTPHDLVWRMER